LKTFRLVDTLEIKDASFKNGILTVHLHNNLPEERKPKKIEIKG
jgi:HSP20 family molecular chaperone IbpA